MPQPYQIAYGSKSLPLRIGPIELPCYILTNGNAVFTKKGLQKALGYDGKSEDWLYDFLGNINKFYPIPGVLFEAYEQPIPIELKHADGTSAIVAAIIPETLEMTCLTIVNAKNDGYLSVGQLKHAKAAEMIINYALENNLHRDIELATGLVFLKESGKKYLQQILTDHNPEPAYQWIKTLPDAFFEKIFDLRQMDWNDLRNNPYEVSEIVHEVIFSHVPENLLEVLRNETPKRGYKSKKKPNDNEHPELKTYTAEILSLLKAAADNWTIFLQLLNRIHPKNSLPELQLPVIPEKNTDSLSMLDMHLQKGVSVNRTYKKTK